MTTNQLQHLRFPNNQQSLDVALGGVPELVHMRDSTIAMRKAKIAVLICQAFLALFPSIINFENKRISHPFNFCSLYQNTTPKDEKGVACGGPQAEKLKSIISYLNQIVQNEPTGYVCFRRKISSVKKIPDFEESENFFCSVKHEPTPMSAYPKTNVRQLYSLKEHERPCAEALAPMTMSTSFEERCYESPELLVLNLISNQLLIGESLVIKGVTTYNKTQRNGDTFTFTGVVQHPPEKTTTPHSLDAEIEDMVRVRSPVTGGHIILCNAVANPNASFHLDPSIFLGRELSRLYCALLPLEVDDRGTTFIQKEDDFTIATTDFGSSKPFGCPFEAKMLLLALAFSALNGKNLRLHNHNGLPELAELSKSLIHEQVHLRFLFIHLKNGIAPPLYSVKFDQPRPVAKPALSEDSIQGVYSSVAVRFQHWRKELKARQEHLRREEERVRAQREKEERDYQKALRKAKKDSQPPTSWKDKIKKPKDRDEDDDYGYDPRDANQKRSPWG